MIRNGIFVMVFLLMTNILKILIAFARAHSKRLMVLMSFELFLFSFYTCEYGAQKCVKLLVQREDSKVVADRAHLTRLPFLLTFYKQCKSVRFYWDFNNFFIRFFYRLKWEKEQFFHIISLLLQIFLLLLLIFNFSF